jgi:tRNA dimethylallyltransferase
VKHLQKILIISGPTASGKSSLALNVTQHIDSIIINADSVQLYKELPILSAQPSKSDQLSNKHVLYSILSHNDASSVDRWLKLVKQEIDNAHKLGKLPIIVGGTGLYISKLVDGINIVPEISDESRKYCSQLYLESGKDGLSTKLLELGENINSIENLDKQRLIRRLEVLIHTKKSLDFWQSKLLIPLYNKDSYIHVTIEPDRDTLYQNCDKRFSNMMDSGAVDEVKALISQQQLVGAQIANTIGFLEIKEYLEGSIGCAEAVLKASKKTRNYAKRQLTWFRNQFHKKITIKDTSGSSLKEILSQL